jgi:uncharacterized repeat protein (TIGR03806 family)
MRLSSAAVVGIACCVLLVSTTPAGPAFPKAFLNMPGTANGHLPSLLSATGAFADVRALKISEGFLPYALNVPFWSDGASKSRWVAVPTWNGGRTSRVLFSADEPWTFPSGTVFVKHFEIATNETHPEVRRRLETRLLVRDTGGGVYGVTYKWRADNSDADLLPGSLNEPIAIQTRSGIRTQVWYYPSREDCKTCHTPLNGGVLGVNTRQLNCDFDYGGGIRKNQLSYWNERELFDSKISKIPGAYPRLARTGDAKRSVEQRARSWLDANCAHCHRPGGTVASFDARYQVPLTQQQLVYGPVLIDEGIDNARAIAPKDPWRSIILFRVNTTDANRMPPLAHNRIDEEGVAVLREWIQSLPGPAVLEPVTITPAAGKYAKSVTVTLQNPEPDAVIHYTLDGSAPAKSDPVYEDPLEITNACVLRAKAYKTGFTKSITSQQVYIISE